MKSRAHKYNCLSVKPAHFSLKCFLAFLAVLIVPFCSTSVDAAIPDCSGGSVVVCGANIPIPDTSAVNTTTEVHIPPEVLGDAYSANSNLSITVRCMADGNGGAIYRGVATERLSCMPFPCQTSNVRVCNTSVSIPGGTQLGGVLHMAMPAPFAKSAFTIECVGSEGNPPVYQITDMTSVSCNGTTGTR